MASMSNYPELGASGPGEHHEELSDADSDLEELEGDIAKLNETVREFLASHQSDGSSQQPVRGGSRARGTRGPRKAAKPRGDITARLAKVNQAFLSGDYARALDLVFEVIRINAETHQAWTALSSIFGEQGEMDRALSAMVYAAHLRPKDVSGWLRCASFALDTATGDGLGNLHTARLCYSAAIRADHSNIDARLGKAAVCHQQGHLAAAISEYTMVLKYRPQDLDLVRKLAEACVDNKHAESAIPSAISAYQKYFELAAAGSLDHVSNAPWHDIGVYVELFASTGRYRDAIHELKALSRWLVGRAPERFWDDWQADDREWDSDDDRRLCVPEFAAGSSDVQLYGVALPFELRIRLAIYRLRLGDEVEAFNHLSWLRPTEQQTADFIIDFPFLVSDLANELAQSGQTSTAITYFQLLRALPGDADSTLLLQLGRCYLIVGEQSSAEECFLASIEADEDIIDARVELANLYEKAREDEEALILAAEAMALRQAHDGDSRSETNGDALPMSVLPAKPAFKKPQHPRARVRRDGAPKAKPVVPRRYRPKRLAGADKRQQDEEAQALKLSEQYRVVRDLKRQIVDGRRDLIPSWMSSSEELIDDFRSLKQFYTWEKYLIFLGKKAPLESHGSNQADTELSLMYNRLTRSLAPRAEVSREGHLSALKTHQGISFDNWLDLFLDYAIGLSIQHRRDEAYQVCEAARDSNVFQTPEYEFSIYIAWSVCAIYTSDEEKCVATARHLMRDGEISDSYRMFALLSYLCQSPASWYTSGPAQKYILRQIKAIDAKHENVGLRQWNDGLGNVADQVNPSRSGLDICLLMLYGHILFTSTSYTYALGYFLRAHALDRDNPMVNLSLGLAYVHYGLKRQSANRQYLLLQGQAFLTRYADISLSQAQCASSAEVYYNMARLFQLLGLGALAYQYYTYATKELIKSPIDRNIIHNISINNITSLLSLKNKYHAFLLIKNNITL